MNIPKEVNGSSDTVITGGQTAVLKRVNQGSARVLVFAKRDGTINELLELTHKKKKRRIISQLSWLTCMAKNSIPEKMLAILNR